MKKWATLLALGMSGVCALHADTIFSTFGPGNSFFAVGSWTVGTSSDTQIAASFVPSHEFTLDEIDFAAFAMSGTQVTVDIATGASSPELPVESFLVTGVPATPTVLTVDSALHPDLSAGVRYWIVLSSPDVIGWNLNDQGFVGVSMRQDSDPWVDLGTEVPAPAFAVLGTPVVTTTVPEPSSCLLSAVMLIPFAMALRTVGRWAPRPAQLQ